jgi:hypothetical protein
MENERRYFDRILLNLPLRIKTDSPDLELSAESRDLAAKGIGLFSKNKIPQQGPIKIQIKIPGELPLIDLTGQIAWSREYFPDGWRAGVVLREQSVNLVTFAVLLEKCLRSNETVGV